MEDWRNERAPKAFLHSSGSPLLHSSISPFLHFFLFSVLAIAWTWPLATHLASRIPHDPGDPILNTWILWWNAHAVPFTARWWDPPFFFPMRGALALSEHLAGIAIVTTPIQIAGGSAILAYNIALLLSYVLSAFFAFLLVRRLSGSTLAGVVGGLAYGFAPYRTGQLGHIQVVTSQWLPLALLGLHTYLETGRRGALALFAAAWLVQSLSNGYYLLFFPVLLLGWMAWFVDWRRQFRTGAAITIVWALASLPLLPVLWKYYTVQNALGLSRAIADMEQFSASPASLLRASPLLAFWPSLPGRTDEEQLFTGITVVALIVAAFAVHTRRVGIRGLAAARSPLVFYTAAAILMYALSFGPAHPGSGVATVLHPYTVLAFLPGYAGLRAPARFAMLGTLCLSIAGALGLHIVLSAARRARTAVTVVAMCGLFVDCWTRSMPMAGPPGRLILPEVGPAAAVIEVPTDDATVNVAAMYRSMFHRQPLINGYTGYIPPHYSILSAGLHRGDPSIPLELARGRALVIVVSDRSDPGQEWRRYVEGLPGIERRGAGSGGTIYVLPAQPAAHTAPRGEAIQASVTEIAPERIELDLGTERIVRTVGFPVRWHYLELGRRMAIEASSNHGTWSTVWEDWTGGPTLAAAIESPLLVPVRLVLPDIRARYLRIHPAPRWLARDVRVEQP